MPVSGIVRHDTCVATALALRVRDVASGSEPVDVRADRAVQGAVAVVTLGAFVFRQPWVIPVLGVLVGAGALLGPGRQPVPPALRRRSSRPGCRPRPPRRAGRDDPGPGRARGRRCSASATLLLLIGLGGVAWIVALAEAGVAAVAATTGVHLGVVDAPRPAPASGG